MTDHDAIDRPNVVNGYPTGDHLLAILGALANPHRLRIIAALSDGPVHVSQLARDVHISRPLLYLHLRKLEGAGLVAGHLELSEHGRALKFYEVAGDDLLITPELVAQAVRTLGDDDHTQRNQ